MRRSLIFIFLILVFWVFCLFSKDLQTIRARNAILIDANSGGILYEKAAYKKIFPASLTKIAIAYFVLTNYRDLLPAVLTARKEMLDVYKPYEKGALLQTLPTYCLETDGTMIHLRPGEQMTLYQLVEALLICSGNDAANVIAQSLEGSVEDFMRKVNHFLSQKGCKRTQLLNPHGLHHPQHFSTAYDLALITKLALKDPLFRKLAAKTTFYRPATNLQPKRIMQTGNRLIKKGAYFYSKAIGVKTGYTSKAGHCLVAAAIDGKESYIAVLLGYDDRVARYQEAIALLEAFFHIKSIEKEILPSGILNQEVCLLGAKHSIYGYLKEPLVLRLKPLEKLDYEIMFDYDLPKFPIRKNDPIGRTRVISKEGDLLLTYPIYAVQDVNEAFLYRCNRFIKVVFAKLACHTNIWGVALLTILGLYFSYYYFLKRKQKSYL